jgi:hypothetical protein
VLPLPSVTTRDASLLVCLKTISASILPIRKRRSRRAECHPRPKLAPFSARAGSSTAAGARAAGRPVSGNQVCAHGENLHARREAAGGPGDVPLPPRRPHPLQPVVELPLGVEPPLRAAVPARGGGALHPHAGPHQAVVGEGGEHLGGRPAAPRRPRRARARRRRGPAPAGARRRRGRAASPPASR